MRISLRICICLFVSVMSLNGYAQLLVTVNEQKSFSKNIPAGNYSGITRLKDDLYALVSDKSDRDGYFIFKIDVDSINGNILNIENKGFVASNVPNRDAEGIAYIPKRKTVLIVGESDDRIMEYDSVGTFTGRELSLEAASKIMDMNLYRIMKILICCGLVQKICILMQMKCCQLILQQLSLFRLMILI